MRIELPEMCLVALVGISGSGKSSFARKHFLPTEVISSDYCRALISDDENDMDSTTEAFELLYEIVGKRLKRGRLTVVDATNLRPEDRAKIVAIARRHHLLAAAIVLDIDLAICQARNKERTDRDLPRHVLRNQSNTLRRGLKGLKREGFRFISFLNSPDEVADAEIVRMPMWTDRRSETGPFDIIGDVHGCMDELLELLDKLGYAVDDVDGDGIAASHSEGRRLIFVGDLVDRGPASHRVLRLVMNCVAAGTALCVPGNHDVKLLNYLRGKQVRVAHGLQQTLDQLASEDQAFIERVKEFIDGLISHAVLDEGRLVVSHAGIREEMQGRASGEIRAFCLYGETTGEIDEFGLPVRHEWAREYRGRAMVVYGHTPVLRPEWLNNTMNIDTGCVFGGALTALRYPEKAVVSVPSRHEYAAPGRPIGHQRGQLSVQHASDEMLHLEDFTGKLLIDTAMDGRMTIPAELTAAALEVMGRFSVHPRWLVHLPPTMSPGGSSERDGYLEHPDEVFAYYRRQGVGNVVCQRKHMGSRAIVVLARSAEAATAAFGSTGGETGCIYTRTGRAFFGSDRAMQDALLERLAAAATEAGLWEGLETDWLCLDCEIMPWSHKALELLRGQYAAVGSAAQSLFDRLSEQLGNTTGDDPGLATLRENVARRTQDIAAYREAYRAYCWEVNDIEDIRVAPFHFLAGQRRAFLDKPHSWHMEMAQRMADASTGCVIPTEHIFVDLEDEASCAAAVDWWLDYTGRGGEGMVVKPESYIMRSPRGLVQPAMKCRGREYLRIIYGPEYLQPDALKLLRSRNVKAKRALALREFVLGVEALERFVSGEPLRRVHECAFAVLALESDPVDPRL